MIALLIGLLVLVVIFMVVNWMLVQAQAPAPFRWIVLLIVILVGLLWLLGQGGAIGPRWI